MTLALQDPAIPFTIFSDVRPQVIRTQGQPNDPVSINSYMDIQLDVWSQENLGHGLFGHAPQHVAPWPAPAQAAFPQPFVHRAPTPVQPGTESIRRFANHYLNDPNSQIDMVYMEPGAADRFKVVIILDISDVL
jgi:hypothetical protein